MAQRDHHVSDPNAVETANDETTPLLSNGQTRGSPTKDQRQNHVSADEPVNGQSADLDEPEEPPMAYLQIIVLCYATLAEPVAFFGIFPFINEMIERTGNVPETSVGFWSGFIEAAFSLVQMILMIVYGRVADRVGRKPVLVFSLAGVSVATALFGMGQRLWHMIALRCVAGVFAGSAVTIRTMISENSTKSTQARAFSWCMFTRNLGILVGPLIGGGLANPADRFHGVFDAPFWRQYPYALSTFVCGAVSLTTVAACAILLNETLVRSKPGEANPPPEMSTWQVFTSPGVPMVIYIYSHVMLASYCFTAVTTVFMYTSVHLGGFGFSDQEIALAIALIGVSQSAWMLLGFPFFQRRFGTGPLLRVLVFVLALFFASWPVENELLRNGWKTAFWIAAPTVIILASSGSMSFACIQLLVNDISPSREVLGTMNALALMASNGIRAFAPVLGTSVFAAGVKWGALDGHLVWIFLIALSVPLIIASWFIPKAAEGLPARTSRSSEQSDGLVNNGTDE